MNPPDPLFAAGGEMGEVMAARDWAATPLGPPDTWPAALRSAVRMLLTSRFPMWMGWGPRLTFFYNEAYRRDTLRAKHPWAMGRSAREVWAEIWPDIGPRLRSVLETGTATWDEGLLLFLERSGYPEETYHTFSYSPLSDEDGAPAGVLCVVTEDTDRVLSERRMATLREISAAVADPRDPAVLVTAAARAMAQNPRDLPFTLVYLFDDDGTARLAASAGLEAGEPGAPAVIEPGGTSPWPLTALRGGRAAVLHDLAERVPPVSAGAWDRPPEAAVTLPLPGQAQAGSAGFLVAGLNPFRRLDERYRGFLDLLAGQLAAALAMAAAYADERRRAEELAELDRAKSVFFANVSHEFRTPLTLLLGPVEQLRAAPAIVADPRLAEEVEVVGRNAARLSRLVNALLDFSRLTDGRTQAVFEPVDLAAVTAELASMFRAAAERAGLELEVDCPPLPEPFHVDRDMWEKVVLNLLSNAVKFTFDGSIAVRMQAAQRDGRPGAALVVADTGIGVPGDELDRLFERFHQIAGARGRSAEGSGIGLALVRELLDLHGGSIGVESELGKGTRFTVWVPAGHAHLPADQVRTVPQPWATKAEAFVTEALRWTDAAPESPDEPAPDGAGRVLVADDNADMREYLVRLLGDHYRVQAVSDGFAALAAIRADPPDLVVSDVMMPGLNGLELVGALRADPITAVVPVLLLSARAGAEAAVEGIAGGADDYLVKPFSAEELLARADGQLRLGRVRREAELRFRALADATPAMIWVDAPDGRRLLVNRAWREFTGGSATEDLDHGWRGRIHPSDRDRYDTVRSRATAAGEAFELEYRLCAADGRYHWVLDRGAPLGPDGAARGYVGGCLDIDVRHRERERRRVMDTIGRAMEAETTVAGRRVVLVRTLVAEGIADFARLVERDGDTAVTVAVAAADPADERAMRAMPMPAPLATAAGVLRPRLFRLDAPDGGDDDRDAAELRQLTRQAGIDMHTAAAVPLRARGRVVGLLLTGRRGESPGQDDEDLALLAEIADRAATVLDNAVLLVTEQATTRRLDLLQRATAALSAAASPTEVARAAVEHLQQLLRPTASGIWELREGATLEVLASVGYPVQVMQDWATMPLHADAPVAAAVRTRRTHRMVRHRDWEKAYPHLAGPVARYGLPGLIAMPLVVGNDALGLLTAAFSDEREQDPAEIATAAALADQCALALQRAGLLAAESAARRSAEELSEVVAALSGATTPAQVGGVILGHAAQLGAREAVVVLRTGDQLDVLAGAGLPVGVPDELHPDPARRGEPHSLTPGRRLHLDATHPIAHAIRTGAPVWHGGRSPIAWAEQALSTGEASVPAQVVVPLVLEGAAIGALGLGFGDAGPPALGVAERTAVLTVAAQCAQALDRARLHQLEHEVADVLQRSLLPRGLPQLDRLAVAERYLPGTADTSAGGDWYDLLPVGEHAVAVVVGDVVGHGPAAAAVMGQLRSALAAYLLDGHGPAAALERLDRFARRIPGAQGSTCVCLTLDWRSGELTWARAGHLPLLLVGPQGATYLDDGAGTVLAVPGRPPYAQARTTMTPGTSVLLYTDGLVERRGEVVDEGLDRLAAAAHAAAATGPDRLATEIVAAVLDEAGPGDDVALVVVRLVPEPLEVDLPASAASLRTLRRAVERWSAEAALPATVLEDLQLAVGEAAANAAEHAYPEPDPGATVTCTVSRTAGGDIAVQVTDRGRWRPVPADRGHRGRGLQVIGAVAQDVQVRSGDDGTEVSFRLPGAHRDGPEPPPPTGGRDRADAQVVPVTGDVDLATVGAIREQLFAALDAGGDVLLDLRGVRHLYSAGVGLLVEATARAEGRAELTVRATAHSAVARVLALTGVDTTLRLDLQP